MARGALLSRHRRVVDRSLATFMKNQQDRIRFNHARDAERFEEVLDAVDTSRGPLVVNDPVDIEVRR